MSAGKLRLRCYSFLPLPKAEVSEGIFDGRFGGGAHLEGVAHGGALEALDGLGHQLRVDVLRRGVVVVRGEEREVGILHLVVPEEGM